MQVISVDELVKYQGENVIVDSFDAVPMSVIEDIKAEIMKYVEDEYINENEAQGMMFCCDIIDKHTKGDTDADANSH